MLWPRVRGLQNRWKRGSRGERGVSVVFAVLGAGFWIGLVAGAVWLVGTFYEVEVFGPILTRKLMEIMLLSLFGLLIFSNTVTALSTFYLSEDLELVLSLPVSRAHFHFARLLDTAVQTSWMMAFFGIPVVIAYGAAYRPGPLFYVMCVLVGIPFAAIPASVGVAVASLLVTIFPARKIKEMLALAGVMGIAVLFMIIRLLRPERLVNPESFDSVAAYVAEIQAPVPLLFPPRWASEIIVSTLTYKPFPWLMFGLLVSAAVATTGLARWLTDSVYDEGRTRAQEARAARFAKAGWFDKVAESYASILPVEAGAIVVKDIKTFFRDPAQWSQLFVLGSILVIAIVSVASFPMDTFRGPWLGAFRSMLAFLDLGLVGFVMAAVAARFQFTAVSAEGRGFWLVRTGPISSRVYLWSKVWPGILPMVLIGEIMAVTSTVILGAGPFMVATAAWLALCLAFALSGTAVGLGAVYADFKLDNAARVAAGPAGMLYMMVASTLVFVTVGLQAPAVYLVLSAQLNDTNIAASTWLVLAATVLVTALVCGLATVLPVNRGSDILWERELPMVDRRWLLLAAAMGCARPGIDVEAPASAVVVVPARVAYLQGHKAWADGDLQAAERYFVRAIAFDPSSDVLRQAHGKVQQALGVQGEQELQ